MKGTHLSRAAVPLLAVMLACGDDAPTPGLSGSLDGFCQTHLPRVEAYLSSFEGDQTKPSEERYGGTVVLGAIGGMNAFVASDYSATQHQMFVNLMTLLAYDDNFQPVPYLARSWVVDDPDHPTQIT